MTGIAGAEAFVTSSGTICSVTCGFCAISTRCPNCSRMTSRLPRTRSSTDSSMIAHNCGASARCSSSARRMRSSTRRRTSLSGALGRPRSTTARV
ncbi:hypothetical protein AUW26_01605 [Streptomyces sp. CC71]|nr:hypothetical protein AUW26_01605 [Streptomyces sp. CC71]